MADQINEYGANISPRSVRRLLNTEGLNARRSRKKRKITSTMAKKRLEWVKGLDHWTTDYWEKSAVYLTMTCTRGGGEATLAISQPLYSAFPPLFPRSRITGLRRN
ncbi:hypothetical protein J6590_011483 [Homalodisca vitripennis]|nr:hypothetical protein J6590_011483 [Homalodisca vitripennis]